MTREEAVARIKDHIEIHRYRERNAVKILEALDMAIKALEQLEPYEEDGELDFVQEHKKLPIVLEVHTIEPDRKKGRWIRKNNYSCTIECSVCGNEMTSLGDNLPSYCCHCGADMREGGE